MDFCILAPQLRVNLDKLLVRLSAGQWQEMNKTRESVTATLGKWGTDMDRVRGWSKELETGERALKRELFLARKQIEESAELAARPPRDLDYYTLSSSGGKGPSTANLQSSIGSGPENAEKQGWLFVKTLTGKPTRTVWIRRWYFVRHGIFGWLVQGQRSGGVEESDRIGVLLCNVRAASQEERRFCFEVKTKDSTIVLQAENQGEMSTWLASFEAAKRRALEDSSRNDSYANQSQSIDPAFAISAPIAPEFAAKSNENYGHGHQGSEDVSSTMIDRSSTLPVPGHHEAGNIASRNSFDVTAGRRSTAGDRDGEGSRDHAARIIQKLDLHRKSNASSQPPGGSLTSSPGTPGLPPSAGGIASLISASHNILPVYHNPVMAEPAPGIASRPTLTDLSQLGIAGQTREPPYNTLAPSTLANPPSATNLSKAAVVVSGERGINMGRNDMPSGMMANLWGSNNWGYLNRLEKGEVKVTHDLRLSNPPSPMTKPVSDSNNTSHESRPSLIVTQSNSGSPSPSRSQDSETKRHRKTISLDDDVARVQRSQVQRLQVVAEEFPSNYPIQLRTQEAQFRMLFPNASRNDKVVMVFRGTWNLNDAQEFPGRLYVTASDLYFYSHHFGLVLISGMSLSSIDEVTAAPGKDCDFLFVHLKEENSRIGYSRITIKIFLEPLRLLQRRLNFLIQNAASIPPLSLESLVRELINLERDEKSHTPSFESWEDVSVNTPVDHATPLARTRSQTGDTHHRTAVRVDNSLYDDSARQHDKEVAKFRLPPNPVIYEPKGMDRLAVSREFDVSPKALFHVIFGDKSAVFQMLYQERKAQGKLAPVDLWIRRADSRLDIIQSPWKIADNGLMQRRFEYQIQYNDSFGK